MPRDMVESIDKALTMGSDWLWSYVLLFALLGTHVYLTVLLKFPQRHLGLAMRYYLGGRDGAAGTISHFPSLMVSLAANVGTGNIVGVATAVAMGGPGAVFWCMLTGALGMATRYAESLLAVVYRVRDTDGEISGGPMYALERGLKCKWLAVVFAVFTALAAFGIGNITQANAAARLLADGSAAIPVHYTGMALAAFVGVVLLFGLQGISRVCTACVPCMALLYIAGCSILIAGHSEYILPAIKLIFTSAFTGQAAGGGIIGSTLMLALQTGVRRGLFSNEAGMGSSPIVSAPVHTRNAVQQALVSSTGPFWDTVVTCTLTGLTLTICLLADPKIAAGDGSLLTYRAFSESGCSWILTISLLTFVISTLLGWSYFGEKALKYLGGGRLKLPYRVLWVVAVYVGCVVPKSSIVWNFADLANGLMALPNLICMVGLSGVLVAQTRRYLHRNHLNEIDPDVYRMTQYIEYKSTSANSEKS